MMVFWLTLFVLHRGYTHIQVTTVEPGDPVTFTCALPESDMSRRVHWYKQGVGDNLKLIWTVKDPATPEFAPEFSHSRWRVDYTKNVCNLTILRTNQEDEGIYHCGTSQWLKNTEWTGTYLLVKGNTQTTSDYTVVQEKTVPAGDSETLQCSVLSHSDNRTCPGGLNMFWFRTQTSHPNIIYTDGNTPECEAGSEPQRRCVYHFSKNISSSDKGTYYCAVATCGEILFGNGTKQMESSPGSEFTALVITIICLAVSVIFNIILICCRTPRASCEPFKENSSSQATRDEVSHAVDDNNDGGYDLNYAALHFSGRNTTRGKKKNQTDESVYSQVKCRM